MKSKFLAWVSALSAVALVSGALVVTANAHIAAGHSPITTDGPDLVSAEADGQDVIACFDEEVSETDGSGATFNLVDFDSNTNMAGDSSDLGNENECVEIGFPNTRPANTFTVLEVEAGAVEDRAGEDNVKNAVEITGSPEGGPGRTTAPDLVSFDVDAGNQEIDYTFDEELDCNAVDEEEFGAYDEDGDYDYGDSLEDCNNETVTIGFTATDVDAGFDIDQNVEDVDTGSNQAGNTGTIQQEAPAGNDAPTQGMGDAINEFPMANDAQRVDDDTWLINFSEDVDDTTCDMNDIELVASDATVLDTASDCDNDEDDSIEVRFDAAGIEDSTDNEMPLIVLDDGAIEDSDDGNLSPTRSLPVGSSEEASGFTDAPDLEEVRKIADDLIAFLYDEPVDEDNSDDDCSEYNVVDAEGNESSGTDLDDVDGNTVTCEFDETDTADMVGGTIEFGGAAGDFLNNTNIESAAGLGSAQSPSASTTTTTSTSTSTTTTTTTRQPRRIKAKTRLSGRYRGGKFTGKASSRFAQCESGRLVTVRKNGGGVVGRDTTNGKGKYSVGDNNANGAHTAKVSKKVFTRGNGDTVVCKPKSKKISA